MLCRVALVLALPMAAAASTSLRGTPADVPATAAAAAEPPLPSAPQEVGAGGEQRNATLNTTAAVLAAVVQTSGLEAYESHFLYNCYEGHGGEPAGIEGLVVDSTEDCAWYCDLDRRCQGFVYMYSQHKCWTRRSIRLSECEVGTEGQENYQFDTFTRKYR